MQEGMKNYGALDHQGVDFTWDKVQTGLQCSAVESPAGLTGRMSPVEVCRGGRCPSLAAERGWMAAVRILPRTTFTIRAVTTLSPRTAFTDNINYIGGNSHYTVRCFFLAMFFISSTIFSSVSKQYFKKFGSSKDVNKYITGCAP